VTGRPWFPDGAASRAVLIGTSEFHSSGLPAIPSVRANLEALGRALTDAVGGLLPAGNCQVVADPKGEGAVGAALTRAVREAEDLLLVYYAGHGLLDDDGLLHFALADTDPEHVGRHRRVVERTVSWLAGCRRLHRRYERKPEHFIAFVGIAAALICHRHFMKNTTFSPTRTATRDAS
jgi:hypothetical protein